MRSQKMSTQTKNVLVVGVALAFVLAMVFWIIGRPEASPSRHSEPRTQISLGPQWGHGTKTTDCRISGSLPDPGCTPGDIIPKNTKEVLCDPAFRTSAVRDSSTSPAEKRTVYEIYGIPHPLSNRGSDQVCEIDHLVPLELGGADTKPNLWPQCSTGYSNWEGASFREKDKFENYLHRQVCFGDLQLSEAQFEIATNWFKYWVAAGRPGD